jgi:hypothetical protein
MTMVMVKANYNATYISIIAFEFICFYRRSSAFIGG